PTAGISRFETLTVVTDGKDSGTQIVNLSGNGLAPNIQFNQTSLFHRTFIPLTDTSAPQYISFTNIGNYPLSVQSIYFTGLDAADYFVSRMPASLVPAGGTDSIGVRFAPMVEGRPDAQVVINTNALNTPSDTIPMFGVGTLERLVINNAYSNKVQVNFDSVFVGADSCLPIVLYNPGSDTLKVLKNFFASADYDFTLHPLSSPDTLIPPGATKTIMVCFQPLKPGFRTATVQILTAIPKTFTVPSVDTSQFTVQFTGTGVPFGNFAITGPDRVDTVLDGTQHCMTDTFWNTGSADIMVTGATISGTNVTEYTPTFPTFPFPLAAHSYKTFQVCVTPTGMSDRTATIKGYALSGETRDSSSWLQDVFGQSTAVTAVVDSAFPAVTCMPDFSTAVVTVTNAGNVPTAYTAGTITG